MLVPDDDNNFFCLLSTEMPLGGFEETSNAVSGFVWNICMEIFEFQTCFFLLFVVFERCEREER